MKQRLLTCIIVVLFLASFTVGCSQERSGVPDALVLCTTSIDMDNFSDYEIIHNVDLDTHIDDLQLVVSKTGSYGKLTQTESLSFQYNKSTDLWTCIERSENVNKMQELDWDKIMNVPPLRGYFEKIDTKEYDYNYNIQIKDIDFSQSRPTVSVDYTFESIQTSTIHSNSVELYLQKEFDGTYSFSLEFEDYKDSSSYFRDTDTYTVICVFRFNYQHGIKFVECCLRCGLATVYDLLIHER